MKTKITGRYIIGHVDGSPLVFMDGCVIYEEDTIIYVGSTYEEPVDLTIDAGNAIISPGFIDLDALCDIDHAILDAYPGPELAKGLEWSEAYFRGEREEIFTSEEEAFRRRYAFVQLIMNGVTTALPISGEYHKHWAETYDEFAQMAEIAAELGLRVYMGPSYRSGVMVTQANGEQTVLWDEALGTAGLHEAVRFVKQYDGKYGGLIKGLLAPARIQTCTTELLQRTRLFADELDCPVRLHAAQEDLEIRLLREWYGETPVELLARIGFLAPKTLLPHATHLKGHHPGLPAGDELPLLSENGVTVVHCPVIEARYGSVLNSYEKYLHAGVNIGLGTDTFPPDMIRVMDLAHNLNKIISGNQWSLDAGEIFLAATLNGARALGREDLGRLSPGAKADMIVIELDALRSGVVDDPIRTMILHTSGWNVKTVIINGRTVMLDHHIPGVDETMLRTQAQSYFEKMRQAYSQRDFRQRPVQELFPPVFRYADEVNRRRAGNM